MAAAWFSGRLGRTDNPHRPGTLEPSALFFVGGSPLAMCVRPCASLELPAISILSPFQLAESLRQTPFGCPFLVQPTEPFRQRTLIPLHPSNRPQELHSRDARLALASDPPAFQTPSRFGEMGELGAVNGPPISVPPLSPDIPDGANGVP